MRLYVWRVIHVTGSISLQVINRCRFPFFQAKFYSYFIYFLMEYNIYEYFSENRGPINAQIGRINWKVARR